MNGNIKNIISYIKEVVELKNKNIYDLKHYLYSMDCLELLRKYGDLIKIKNDISILTNDTIFQIKYINDSQKKKVPDIPEELKIYLENSSNELYENINEYVQEVKDNNQLEYKSHNIQNLINNNQYKNYLNYLNILWNIKRYNRKIDDCNELYLKLYNFYKRIADYEEKIEFILATDLMFWQSNNGEIIKRHIMEATLKIDVDAFTNTISLSINNELKKGMVSDFLNHKSYEVKESQALYTLMELFNEKITSETEIDFNEYLNKYANAISYNNQIYNIPIQECNLNELKRGYTYIFNNKHIIIRNKNAKLWVEDLNKILETCDNEKINSPILNLLDVDFEDSDAVENLLNSNYITDNQEEVLFPLATNNEQYNIIERIRKGNLVLVQGPPGTGKSHTIANLISQFISEGKRVVVTSEKAKALEVIREKLPKEIRSLSLALLSSKGIDKDLEFSIENVLKKQEQSEELDLIKNNIEILEQELKRIRKEKVENQREIINLMNMDTISHEDALKYIINDEVDYNLSTIAKWLSENRKYDLIPQNDNDNIEYNNLAEMFENLNTIADTIKNENFSIIKNLEIKPYLNDNSLEQLIIEYQHINNYEIKNPELKDSIIFENLNIETINNIEKEIEILNKISPNFDKKWVLENIKYPIFIDTITKIKNDLKTYYQDIYNVEKNKTEYSIQYDFKNIDLYQSAINKLLNSLNDKEELSWINKITNHSDIKLINDISIKSITKPINSILDKNILQIINNKLIYDKRISIIKETLLKIYKKDIFEILEIDKEEFGKSINKLNEFLDSFIHYSDKINLIDTLIQKMINIKIYNITYNNTEYSIIKNILTDLKYYTTKDHYLDEINKIDKSIIKDYQDDNLVYLNNLTLSIRNCDLEKIKIYKEKLRNEINTINRYYNIKEIYNHFFTDKKYFIYKYIYELTNEERNFVLSNIENILKYHYVKTYYHLKEDKVDKLPDLFIRRDELQKQEQSKVIKLIELKGWYSQIKNMTPAMMTSLGKWINLKRKYGKGTGKNANAFLHQMQEEMSVSKNAIPVWIMPVDKLIEQYPFSNNPPFDVLIMDESSQTSILSISALTRGKKIIIVGDDKQISPISVGQSIEEINDLRIKYLRNNQWSFLIENSTSIYDIVQTVCNSKKIVLTEHFRCLPEIINYSRYQFYNGEINPLKVRSVENTIKKPIITHYVEDATCKKVGTNPYNIKEINYIIKLLGEIDIDPQYDDKSIGIIVLQNSSRQIQKIAELIMQTYGEKFIHDRKIKVGDSYDFQGDERDVIILSMVISPTDESGEPYRYNALTKKEFDRSFNVAASRAKEQMILVHSVKLEELNPNCNRAKLLSYCQTYDKEKQKDIEELFESNFEKDIYYSLKAKNINLIPQYKVGKYRIDFIVENKSGINIAIECDGDKYHGIEEYSADLERQTILERCGWKFVRIRASNYYYEKEKSINEIVNEIKQYLSSNEFLYEEAYESLNNESSTFEYIDLNNTDDEIFI